MSLETRLLSLNNGFAACARSRIGLLAAVVMLSASMVSVAFAGAKTGDITIESDVGSVTTIGVGSNTKTETNVHSVRVHDGYSTGNIVIQGKESNVVNINTSRKNKTVNRGSVIVGPRK